jgi:hypothetical protein
MSVVFPLFLVVDGFIRANMTQMYNARMMIRQRAITVAVFISNMGMFREPILLCIK